MRSRVRPSCARRIASETTVVLSCPVECGIGHAGTWPIVIRTSDAGRALEDPRQAADAARGLAELTDGRGATREAGLLEEALEDRVSLGHQDASGPERDEVERGAPLGRRALGQEDHAVAARAERFDGGHRQAA